VNKEGDGIVKPGCLRWT